MIYFDVTKSGSARHHSGLVRLSGRLGGELGGAAASVRWPDWDRRAGPSDWFLTAELFSEAERPGLWEFLRKRPCRCAAVFPDAIPLKFPAITWPRSVARHPEYMKLLAGFDRVWAISQASRDELLGYWKWLGVAETPVDVLGLGADSVPGEPRVRVRPARSGARRSLLCVGIIEPRKNQAFLLDVCEELWGKGVDFDLDLVGRVNPIFGQPILKRIGELSRRFPQLKHHRSLGDKGLAELFSGARACVLPTLAEGCGLPLLESLWRGVPVVASDLPVIAESAAGGGCSLAAQGDRAAWAAALERILTDDAWHAELAQQALSRPLPTWAEAAATLRRALA